MMEALNRDRRDCLSVAELCEPYDRNYAAWEMFVRTEREYDEKTATLEGRCENE